MTASKTGLWRVPAAMALSGLIGRMVGFPLARLFLVRLEDGSHTSSPLFSPCMNGIYVALFLAAGWLLLRGMDRRTLFRSATLMVAYGLLVLAVEQIGQVLAGGGILLLTYYLYIPTEAGSVVTSLLFRLAPETLPHWGFVLLAIPSCFLPYLYLVFGRKAA